MKTPNCLTPTSNPWNEGLKPSNSHVQPLERRLQTIQLSCPTHGTKASNCPTLTSNPWNEGLKPSNSHVQPMAQRPQTGIQNPCNKGSRPSTSHVQPTIIHTSPK